MPEILDGEGIARDEIKAEIKTSHCGPGRQGLSPQASLSCWWEITRLGDLRSQQGQNLRQQAEARDEVELELLRRSSSALPDKALPDKSVDQISIRATACASLPHA